MAEECETKKPKKSKKNKKSESPVDESMPEESIEQVTVECTESMSVSHGFSGSNLSTVYGYTPYNISCSLEEIIIKKQKKSNAKRLGEAKNLNNDPKFYEMNKRKLCS